MSRMDPSDLQRFERVYAANLPLILGYAGRRCAVPSDAADIAAEVFVVAWRRLREVPDGEERLWLFGVARRVLSNHRRGQLRWHRLADRLRDELAGSMTAEPGDEAALAVREAIATLPEADQELLRLAVWDGLTPSEIAALEDVPAATVRSRLMRARARLRLALATPVAARGAAGHVVGGAPFTDPTTEG
jgi:RNA polymerase sigma-70 factor, ECF subfamily